MKTKASRSLRTGLQRRERHSGMRDEHKASEAVWKIESTRLIAGIARVTGDIGIAEELAQDALVAALERWPDEGIPEKPAAWLMTAAKRRAIDALRRGRMLELKHGEIARELEFQQQRLGEAMDQALDQVIDDDVLRLIFTACHPVLAVEGRLALMELQASRTAARRGPTGEAVLLSEQDRSLWDHPQIQRGMAALQRAQQLGGGAHSYALQAAIAACHARANTAAETDWERIVLLYDALLQISPSPIVALNRAVAVGMARGPAAGLHALHALAAEPALATYHLLPTHRP